MTYTRTALVALACLYFGCLFAQTGPAGVKDNTENRLWYKAEQLAILPANSALSSWENQGGNASLNAFESGNKRASIVANTTNFNGFQSVVFDGSNDLLLINNSSDINTHSGHLSEKSYALVFRTGNDVNTRQVIYEEGGNVRGVNVFIENGRVYFGAYNLPNDGAGNSDMPIDYSVNDHDPLSGTSYYRVRQMDYSGMSNSTEIKAVERMQNDNDFELSLYPNPSSDYVTIDSPEDIEGEAILMSMHGQVIAEKKFG